MIINTIKRCNMNKNGKKTKGNIIKGMAVGLALGTAITMVVAGNKKISKKMRTVSENVTDTVSNVMNFK